MWIVLRMPAPTDLVVTVRSCGYTIAAPFVSPASFAAPHAMSCSVAPPGDNKMK